MYILTSDEMLFMLKRGLKRYRIRTRFKNFRQSPGTIFNYFTRGVSLLGSFSESKKVF